jgi:hypothetical protein
MTPPLAHIGHWYHAGLYLAPVVLIGCGLWWSGRRDARERAERAARGADTPTTDAQD